MSKVLLVGIFLPLFIFCHEHLEKKESLVHPHVMYGWKNKDIEPTHFFGPDKNVNYGTGRKNIDGTHNGRKQYAL